MSFDIQALGFTKEELQDRVVQRISDELMESMGYDPECDETYQAESEFAKEAKERIIQAIDARLSHLAETVIVPVVNEQIDSLVIQRTNAFGEKQGQPVTFTEYLVDAGNAFLMEAVDYKGERVNKNSFDRDKGQARIAHLLDQHIHYKIKAAMTDAVQQVTKIMAEGLAETAKLKVEEAMANVARAVNNANR